MSRGSIRGFSVSHLGLAVLLLTGQAGAAVSGPTAGAAKPASTCSAEQGQTFIEEGQYDQAIKEFTCVIAAQPTGVEGYRGRIEAELLLGRYADAVHDNGRVTTRTRPAAIAAQIEAGVRSASTSE